jgi:hypothetical protein
MPITLPIITALACCAPALPLAQEEMEPPAPARRWLPHPAPAPNAEFGYAVIALDFDGDGERDVAASAPGESALYVFLGPDLTEVRRFTTPEPDPADRFGVDLAAGPVDDFPGDDILVGAPRTDVAELEDAGRVWLISARPDFEKPIPIAVGPPVAGAQLGTSVAIGDFDGDGEQDLAAGAPKTLIDGEASGAVFFYSLARRERWQVDNPLGAWKHGNFGHALAAADGNGDGCDDLFVSALGNRSGAGVRLAGQCYVLLGSTPRQDEVPSVKVITIEDPTATEGDGARFGMSIHAGDVNGDGCADFLIGAPRKNGGGVKDAGQGFLFYGPGFEPETHEIFLRPDARPHDILGFKSLVADVVGDRKPDVIIASLARDNPPGILIWDGAHLRNEPVIVEKPEGGRAHYLRGFLPGARGKTGRRELLLGDPESPREGKRNVGRVLIEQY